jgi:hypothetical protein
VQEIINSWALVVVTCTLSVPTIKALSKSYHRIQPADADRIHKLKIMFSVDANDDNDDDDCDDDYYYAIRLH